MYPRKVDGNRGEELGAIITALKAIDGIRTAPVAAQVEALTTTMTLAIRLALTR